MSTPSKLPWYQFSLRSVLLLTLVVAVLCSIGACTHWLVSVMLDSVVLIGGVTGRIVGGTGLGLVEGALYGIVFCFIAFLGLATLAVLFGYLWDLYRLAAICAMSVLLGGIFGGVLGGLSARIVQGKASDRIDTHEHHSPPQS